MSELATSARRWADICESQGRVLLAGLFTDLADAVDGSALEAADTTIRELVAERDEAHAEVKRLNEWINTYAYDRKGFKI